MKPLLAGVALLLASGLSAQTYHIASTWPIGGTGSYDYVRFDAAGHRLFVSHQTEVAVIDTLSGRMVGKIPGQHGVHGIALVTGLNRGFITNGLSGSVVAFDLSTLAVTGEYKTGGDKPDGIEYDAGTGLLVISNGHSHTVSLMTAATGQVAHLVNVAGNPESIALDGQGRAFVNLESANTIAQIDLARGTVLSEWKTAPGEGPTGLALDRAHHRLIATCGGNETCVVLESVSGKRIAALPIGDDSDAVAFNPDKGLIFSSNRDGTLTIIHENDTDHFQVVQTVQTQFGAKTLALDPVADRVYLPVAKLTAGPDEDHPGPAVPDTFKIIVVTP